MSARLAPAFVLALIATGALADERKSSDPRLDKAAGEFAAAVAAEKKQDVAGAIDHYERSWKIAPNAATAFNLAELYVKQKRFGLAIRKYALYMSMMPAAKDRARVAKIVADLFATPATIRIESKIAADTIDLAKAYVFLDGKLAAKPGDDAVKLDKASNVRFVQAQTMNPHPVIDVFTEKTSLSQTIDVDYGAERTVLIGAPATAPGPLIVSGYRDFAIYYEGKRITSATSRLDLPPGDYSLLVFDGDYECSPVTTRIPRTGVIYVHVGLTSEPPTYPSRRPTRCRLHSTKIEWLHF